MVRTEVSKDTIILALDPGKRNFAYSFISLKNGVLETGYLDTISDFCEKLYEGQFKLFMEQVDFLLGKYPLELVVAERFQVRGGGRGMGAVAEYINFMLGVVGTRCIERQIELFLIGAGPWKGSIKRIYGLHEMRKLLQERWSDHEADSIGMGIFTFEVYGYAEKGTMVPLILGKPNTVLSKAQAKMILQEAVKKVKEKRWIARRRKS